MMESSTEKVTVLRYVHKHNAEKKQRGNPPELLYRLISNISYYTKQQGNRLISGCFHVMPDE